MTLSQFDQHAAKKAVNDLQVECAAIDLLLVHLVSRLANEHAKPRDWLCGFADEIHESIDRVANPTEPQAQWMVESLRDRLDKLIYGANVRLSG